LTYGNEAWTVSKLDENRIRVTGMKFMKRMAVSTGLNYKSSDLMKELNTQIIMKFITY
jgi:hypothetical protein